VPDWTTELKESVIAKYKAAQPTPENTTEIVKDIAEALGEGFTSNGVRVILVKATNDDGTSVYLKKAPTTGSSSTTNGAKSTRVNKTDAINGLKKVIEANGLEVDEDIVGKLTGKAAIYFSTVIEKATEED
jgi:hypothetical protein